MLPTRWVEFVGEYKVPMRVLSSFTSWDIEINAETKSGTLVTSGEDEKMEQTVVTASPTRSWAPWPIQMISTSKLKTSVVIDEKYVELAVRSLHKAFELDQEAAQTARSAPEMGHNSGIGNVTEWPKVLPC